MARELLKIHFKFSRRWGEVERGSDGEGERVGSRQGASLLLGLAESQKRQFRTQR